MESAEQHWAGVYGTKAAADVNWHQPHPDRSLRLVRPVADPTSSVIDVGAGASTLADELLQRGWRT